MKRSEMISKLGARIYLELGPKIGDLEVAQKLANLVLSDAEDLKMLPPFSYDVFYKNWSATRDQTSTGNEWEPECDFCKGTGKHLAPDVSTPIVIKCTNKNCDVRTDETK